MRSATTWTARSTRALVGLAGIVGLLTGTGCVHALMSRGDVTEPPASAFGMGARASAGRNFVVSLEASEPLAKRRLQTMRVLIRDAAGAPVNDATVTVDGGMPQHRHGLPTRPRVTGRIGDGAYEVEGLRFSMGGWWEVRLAIATPSASDSVTFNLRL